MCFRIDVIKIIFRTFMKLSLFKTIIFIFIISLLFKPTWLFNNGTLTDEVDDLSYWLHSATLSYDQDILYINDYQLTNDTISHITNAPFHAPGSGYMASPFVFLFSWLDILFNGELPDRINPVNTFSYAGYFASTLFYCYLAFLYLGKIQSKLSKNEVGIILFITFISTLVHFVTTRFLMSHVYEFFLVSILIYLFDKNNNHFIDEKDLYKILIAYFFLSITRPSTFLFTILFFGIFKLKFKSKKNTLISRISLGAFAITLSTIYVFLAKTIYAESTIGLNISSNSTTSGYLSNFNLERVFSGFLDLFNIFFSTSMGIAWSTPIVLIGICVLLLKNNTYLDLRMIYVSIYILSYFLVLFIWQGSEVAYGQRLLIGLTPFMCYVVLKIKDLRFFKLPLLFSSIITYVGYIYFYSSQNLTLRFGENLYGNITKWSAESYYLFLFKEIFYIENIISVLSRTIYAINFFKFSNFDSLKLFITRYINLDTSKVEKLESYVASYESINSLYFLIITILIICFSYLFQKLLRD